MKHAKIRCVCPAFFLLEGTIPIVIFLYSHYVLKKHKNLQIQIYSKGTNKPEHYNIPLRVIGGWILGLIIIILGFVFWLPGNMISLKNFNILEISKEQREMQLNANKLEKQINEINSQIEAGRDLRNKINDLSGIPKTKKELNNVNEKKTNGKTSIDTIDIERIKKTLETFKILRDSILKDSVYASSLPLLHPLKKARNKTNKFGLIKDVLTQKELPHRGLDFAVVEGDTVIATGNGVISGITNDRFGFGTTLEIQHNANIKTIYSHLQRTLVQKSKVVKKGQPIAIAGKSGSVLWPVLHYEVRLKEQPINPEDYFITN